MNRGKFLRALLGATPTLWLPAALAGETTLYQQREFQGERYTLRRSAADLERSAFNSTAASIVVRSGVWEACSGSVLSGTCVRLDPGEYNVRDGKATAGPSARANFRDCRGMSTAG